MFRGNVVVICVLVYCEVSGRNKEDEYYYYWSISFWENDNWLGNCKIDRYDFIL